jgi:hypothetical protein
MEDIVVVIDTEAYTEWIRTNITHIYPWVPITQGPMGRKGTHLSTYGSVGNSCMGHPWVPMGG